MEEELVVVDANRIADDADGEPIEKRGAKAVAADVSSNSDAAKTDGLMIVCCIFRIRRLRL